MATFYLTIKEGTKILGLSKSGKFIEDRDKWKTWGTWIGATRYKYRSPIEGIKDAVVKSYIDFIDVPT